MATTEKGIYYPADYDEVADIPDDMKKMAESIDDVIEHDRGLVDEFVEETNQKIETIQAEQTTQNENIQENTDSIEALTTKHNTEVAELQSQIEELQEENQALEDQIPTGEATGSDITLSDSARYYFKKIELGGKSEQTTYAGKNFANINNIKTSSMMKLENNNIILQNNNSQNGYNTTNITLAQLCPSLKIGDNVELSFNTTSSMTAKNIIYFSGASDSWAKGTKKTITQAMLDSTVVLYGGYNEVATISEFMISTEGGAYEPYTGGQPAPNPGYECPIQNVTGDVEVKVENENLCSLVQVPSNNKNTIRFYINPKFIEKTFSIAFTTNEALSGNSLYCVVDGQSIGVIGTLSGSANARVNTSITLTEENFAKIKSANTVYFNVYKSGAVFTVPEDAQIKNGTITDYVPHEEQTAIFPLEEGQRLHKDDTIEDKIVQKRKTLVFDGTENWSFSESRQCFMYSSGLINKAAQNSLSNYFIEKAITALATEYGMYTKYTYQIYIGFPNATLEEFKAWLAEKYASGKPLTIEYWLDEPIEIPFTEAQRTAKANIDKLYSYKGTTHITSNANLDVTYRKDLETMIDKMEELDARLSLLES